MHVWWLCCAAASLQCISASLPYIANVKRISGSVYHTWQPSLFSRESPSLEGSLLISPFLTISFPYFLPFFNIAPYFIKCDIFKIILCCITIFSRKFRSYKINRQPELLHSGPLSVIFEKSGIAHNLSSNTGQIWLFDHSKVSRTGYL